MHSEIKDIASAFLATFMIPIGLVVSIFGGLYALSSPQINIVGIFLFALGIAMNIGGYILGEQQKDKLTKSQITKKLFRNTAFTILLIVFFVLLNNVYV